MLDNIDSPNYTYYVSVETQPNRSISDHSRIVARLLRKAIGTLRVSQLPDYSVVGQFFFIFETILLTSTPILVIFMI